LQWSEHWYDTAKARQFSVQAEGRYIFEDVDIFQQAGLFVASNKTIWGVTVTDGVLNLRFDSCAGQAMLAGLVIRESTAADISTASSPVEHLSAAELAKVVMAINAGGDAYTAENGIEYAADAHYQGGTPVGVRACVAGTRDDAVYQDERVGDFSYELPLPNGHYDVVLQLNEIWLTTPNERIFSVNVQGQKVLYHVDLFRQVGKNQALNKVIRNVPVIDGKLQMSFESESNYASLTGIVVKTAENPTDPTLVTEGGVMTNQGGDVVMAINAGGEAYTSSEGVQYMADFFYDGGMPLNHAEPITGTVDDLLYQHERFGNFVYAIPLPNAHYDIELAWSEPWYSAENERLFHVMIENTVRINNLDIFAHAGMFGVLKTVLTNVAVDDGMLEMAFIANAGYASLSTVVIRNSPAIASVPNENIECLALDTVNEEGFQTELKITNKGSVNLTSWEAKAYLGSNDSFLTGSGAEFAVDGSLVTLSNNANSEPLLPDETLIAHLQGQTSGSHKVVRCY
ncbi:MAG: hypothetical protein EOO68_21970, partial [Moraxellaceae bacterium]